MEEQKPDITKVCEENGWGKYEYYVLKELERQANKQNEICQCLINIKTEIATLKTKASIWGALGGLVASLATIILAVALALLRS